MILFINKVTLFGIYFFIKIDYYNLVLVLLLLLLLLLILLLLLLIYFKVTKLQTFLQK